VALVAAGPGLTNCSPSEHNGTVSEVALVGEVSARGSGGGGPDGRSTAEIEAAIADTRGQLAATLDEIAVRVHPSTVAAQVKAKAAAAVDRTVGRAYVTASHGVERVRSELVDDRGALRLARVVPVALASLAVVVTVAAWRRRK
jgi:hypothetical protein